MGSSLKALRGFPVKPRRESGYALQLAQWGERHPDAKPLRGYNGAGVIELVDSFDTDTYRTIYTVDCRDAIFVLHAFKKKSKKGRETPKAELDLVKKRYAAAMKLCNEPPPDLAAKIATYQAATRSSSAAAKHPTRQ